MAVWFINGNALFVIIVVMLLYLKPGQFWDVQSSVCLINITSLLTYLLTYLLLWINDVYSKQLQLDGHSGEYNN